MDVKNDMFDFGIGDNDMGVCRFISWHIMGNIMIEAIAFTIVMTLYIAFGISVVVYTLYRR